MRVREDICGKEHKRINSKGQEEIAGFVLIVALVVVILIVALVIFLRNDGNVTKQDIEVSQFLDSLLKYTTDCGKYEGNYLSVGDLIIYCSNGKKCFDKRDACSALNDTLEKAISASWNIQKGSYYSGYLFTISAGSNSTQEVILESGKGDCNKTYSGATYPLSNSGINIENSLRICTSA